MENVSFLIRELVDYACREEILDARDRTYATNALMAALHEDDYNDSGYAAKKRPLAEILADLLDFAVAKGLTGGDTVVYRDLFDTKLMGCVTPAPSAVIDRFYALFRVSPEAATDWFYHLCRANNYIRTDRVSRDLKWTVESPYGDIDITVNLSKPEKTPRRLPRQNCCPPKGIPNACSAGRTRGTPARFPPLQEKICA